MIKNKPIVYITVGLPASGKSTWAREMASRDLTKYTLVSRDELRAMLHLGHWSRGNEKFVVAMRDAIILKSIADGKNTIVHDTNFGHNVDDIRALVAGMAEVMVKDFTDVPLEVCLERDAKRGEKSVGAKVIKDFYKRYLKVTPAKPEYIEGAADVVICDLDGTIALMNGRNPYDASECEKDLINPVVDDILSHCNHGILFVSGRSSKYYQQTKDWLITHGYGGYRLLMRKEDDNRDDRIVKQEIYDSEIKGVYNVLFVLDDRNKVVEMWRSNGLVCLQVAEGDF
jgi:predicted kinase